MKNNIRFGIAALLITGICLLMLAGFSNAGGLLGLTSFFLTPRAELTRPIRRRELWWMFGVLFVLIMLVAAANCLPSYPSESVGRVTRHPAVVLPLWLLMLWGIHGQWQRQRGKVDA